MPWPCSALFATTEGNYHMHNVRIVRLLRSSPNAWIGWQAST